MDFTLGVSGKPVNKCRDVLRVRPNESTVSLRKIKLKIKLCTVHYAQCTNKIMKRWEKFS